MVQAVERQFQPVGYAQLVVYLAQVVLDHLFGGADLVGDLLVPHAARDAADDGQLFLGEFGQDARAGERTGLRAIGLDHPTDGLVVDPGLAVGDLANAFDQRSGEMERGTTPRTPRLRIAARRVK